MCGQIEALSKAQPRQNSASVRVHIYVISTIHIGFVISSALRFQNFYLLNIFAFFLLLFTNFKQLF